MIIFLLGPEEFLREERRRQLVEEIPAEEREASIVDLAGQGLTPDVLAANVQALPFFSTRRLVIVRGLLARSGRGGGDRIDWAAYATALEATAPTTSVALLEADAVPDTHPLLKRRRPDWQIERFATPRQHEVDAWVRRRARTKGLTIAPEAARLLAESGAGQLRLLDLELDKLAAYAGERRIERADVEELVHAAGNSTIFALADALLTGRRKAAAHLLRELIEGGADPHQILAILAGQYRVVVHARRGLQDRAPGGDLRAALGLSPRYPLEKAQAQAAAYARGELETAYAELLRLDWEAKTGRAELASALDLFVFTAPAPGR